MRNYKIVSLKYLKKNKKQSKFIIMSILLSSMLIMVILSGFLTINNFMKENAINSLGKYDLKINNIEKFKSDKLSSNSIINEFGDEYLIDAGEIVDKCNVNIVSYDDNLKNIKQKTIQKGRFPNNESEVALDEWVLNLIDADLEDLIEIKINDKISEFKIVGILKNKPQAAAYEDNPTIIIKNNLNSTENQFCNTYISITDNTNIDDAIDNISKDLDLNKEQIEKNTIGLSASFKDNIGQNIGIIVVILFICFIVICSSITVIRNAINILIIERTKELGFMKAIGATKKQIKKIVRYELLSLGIISIPIGICTGFLLLQSIILIINLNSKGDFKAISNIYVICITIVIEFLSIIISSRKPLNNISKIDPIKLIKGEDTKPKITSKNNKGILYNHLSVIEKIAYKNMRVNKKKFLNIIISISISVALFISFYALINYGFSLFKYSQSLGEYEGDLRISYEKMSSDENITDNPYIAEEGFTDKYYNDLKAIYGVRDVYKKNFKVVVSSFKYDKLDNEYIELLNRNSLKPETYNNNEYTFNTCSGFYGYNDEQLDTCRKYLQKGEVDANKMNSENGVIIVQNSIMLDESDDKTKNINISNLSIGDEIFLDFNINFNSANNYGDTLKTKGYIDTNQYKKVKVIGIITEVPYDRKNQSGGIGIIATNDVYSKLTGKNTTNDYDIILDSNIDKSITSKKIKEVSNKTPNSIFKDFNEINKNTTKYNIELSILLYGIALIVFIIALLNINNTISTNILLKSKEFAVLKALGATSKKLNRMIISEGIYYGIIGSIYGSLLGIISSLIIYNGCFSIVKSLFILGRITDFPFKFPWIPISLSILITILSCVIFSITPLKKLKENNIVDSIKEE